MLDLVSRIESHADALPPAERRVAELVLADPSAAAFTTVAELGRRAGTSGATVVRLADRLGYGGWVGLQSEVRATIDQRLRPATERIREHEVDDVLAATAAREAENVHRTLEAVDRASFERAVALLAHRRRVVRVLAGAAQDGVGATLSDTLDLLRAGVVRIGGSPVAVTSQLAHTEPGDVLVAIDLRRYERWVLEAAESTSAAGGLVIALTDSRLSPLARLAEVAFTITAEGAGPFDSHVGTLALANALATGVAAKLRRPATQRLDRVEAAWRSAGALTDG
ncbi:MAG: MurR/RpiR family transcriptional regulator [Acidimicrobiales bacterium]